MYICGDIHGQYYDLVNIFCRRPPLNGRFFSSYAPRGGGATEAVRKKHRAEPTDGGPAQEYSYLFLGDYVDRGPRSLEVMVTLLCLKILAPEKLFLLRGNHETELISKQYGFFDECKRRYSVKLHRVFVDLFKEIGRAHV